MIKKIFGALLGRKEQPEASASAKSGGKTLKDLEHFVDYVVRALVDQPDVVGIETINGERGQIIQVSCASEDVGKIIGKSGKTISAIRALVNGAGRRFEQDLTVEVKSL